jgi:hypothetical protein
LNVFLSFCIFAAFLLGAFFAFTHADHDCSGEDCPVCAQMKDAFDALNRLLMGLRPSAAICPLLLSLSVAKFLREAYRVRAQHTLVTEKIRLND